MYQRAPALIERPECLFGGRCGKELVEVPFVPAFVWRLNLKQIAGMNFPPIGTDVSLAEAVVAVGIAFMRATAERPSAFAAAIPMSAAAFR